MLAKTTTLGVRGALALLALCLLPTALAPLALADSDVIPTLPRLPALPIDLCALPPIVWSLNTGTVGAVLSTDVTGVAGAAESKWKLVAAPTGVPLANFVVNDYPGWLNTGSFTARWVSPVQTAGTANSAAAGGYQYDLQFFTYCVKRASLRFCYAADNRVAFLLNGSPLVAAPPSPASQFKTLSCVYFGPGSVPFGLNTLSALVANDNGPTGLFVTGGSTS